MSEHAQDHVLRGGETKAVDRLLEPQIGRELHASDKIKRGCGAGWFSPATLVGGSAGAGPGLDAGAGHGLSRSLTTPLEGNPIAQALPKQQASGCAST